ncbi:MAG: guanine deaminase [Castellaniella sp.]
MSSNSTLTALRGPALSFRDNPFLTDDAAALHYEPDALILIRDGIIEQFGDYADLRPLLDGMEPAHYADSLIMPGFIDAHVHYPQTQIIGSYGAQLIDWLNTYTFVAEQQFKVLETARKVATFFLEQTLASGTTTATVYCTVHPASVEGFFQAAEHTGQRMIAGKVMMDRNAPEALLDTAQSSYDDSLALLDRWHGRGRLLYAITPRFAPTSTPAQLEAAAALWQARPDVWMQTHLSENPDELEWVSALFPERRSYVDVYRHYGLLGPRALMGHAIHLQEAEWEMLAQADASVIHCPASNAFLGSGCFDIRRACAPEAPAKALRTALATDVGGGTSLSMLRIMGDAYRNSQAAGMPLSAPKAFWLATAGAARALHLDTRIGRIAAGLEADLVVLNLKSTPLIDFRMQHCDSLEEALFIQMTLADERAIEAVYIGGELRHSQPANAGTEIASTGSIGGHAGISILRHNDRLRASSKELNHD